MNHTSPLVGPILIAMAAVSMIFSAATWQVAPDSPDLYHLVYPDSDRARGEGTLIFLFIFPLIQILLASAYYYMRRIKRRIVAEGWFIAAGSLFFLFVNSLRCAATWIAFS